MVQLTQFINRHFDDALLLIKLIKLCHSTTLQPSPYSSDYGIYTDTVSTSGLVHYYNNPNGSTYDYNQYSQNPYSSHFPSNISHTSPHANEMFNNVQSLDINSSNGKTGHHFNCNLMETTSSPASNSTNIDHVRGLVKVIQTNKIKEEIISSMSSKKQIFCFGFSIRIDIFPFLQNLQKNRTTKL